MFGICKLKFSVLEEFSIVNLKINQDIKCALLLIFRQILSVQIKYFHVNGLSLFIWENRLRLLPNLIENRLKNTCKCPLYSVGYSLLNFSVFFIRGSLKTCIFSNEMKEKKNWKFLQHMPLLMVYLSTSPFAKHGHYLSYCLQVHKLHNYIAVKWVTFYFKYLHKRRKLNDMSNIWVLTNNFII